MEKVTRRTIKGTRLEYSLVGEVVTSNEQSVLVKRSNSNTYFWIDKDGHIVSLNKGETGIFPINISTFISNKGQPEGLIVTKFRLANPAVKTREVQPGTEFLGGMLLVNIEEVIPTTMQGLFLMKLVSTSNNETIWARFYNPTETPTHTDNKIVKLRPMKTKLTITKNGEVFEDQETREEDIGVGKVQTKYPKWFTWLEVTEIMDPK